VEEAEAEEKIRLKQYVSLLSKGRHNKIEENQEINEQALLKCV
jgi:hypothetical protein